MATSSDISSNIVNALYLSDPELDTAIGTPLRKIIDAVSDQIAQSTVDSYLIDYQYDVDSKTGGDLDDFCANFGISRLLGVRATGTLTFARSVDMAASQAVTIPAGTQATTGSIPPQTFQTTVASTMDVGQASVDIPAQAIDEGPDSNILANTPLMMLSMVAGVTTVSNTAAFVGGSIDETDAQLQARFKSTVFRNLAGTDSMYRGIALQTLADSDSGSFSVAQANILGATSHNIEQVQFVSGSASVSLTTAAYFVTSSVTITDSLGNIYSPTNQYTVSANNSVSPATMTITTGGTTVGMPDAVYNVEYDYVPIVSRNDPFNSRFGQGVVNNRVDVIVNGQIAVAATQSVAYVTSVLFNNTTGDPLLRTKFVSPTGTHPASGDVFIPLGFGPVLSLPASIVIAGTTYTLGTNYDIVHQDDAFGYAPNSMYGIWWKTTTNGTNPAANSIFTVAYTYNSIPISVMNNLANWRLLGTDVQVHAGKIAYLNFNFAIVYDSNITTDTVNASIQTTLDAYLKRLGFNAAVQVSDIVQVVHNVPGVDNVRLTTSTDNPTTYGIQLVQSDGTVISTYNVGGNPTDVYFDERTYPLLHSIAYSVKARNTFRN